MLSLGIVIEPLFRAITNPFQACVSVHVETNHFICSKNDITVSYMKFNLGLKQVNDFEKVFATG